MGRPKVSDASAASRTTVLGEGRVTKQKGELGELFFVLKAASLGFAVSKPYGDSLPFDFVLGTGKRMLRMQVKTAFSNSRRGFLIHAGFGGSKHTPYTAEDIDFIAAYVAPYEAWYIIPVGAIGTYPSIRVYPDGCRKLGSGRFERYRDAWHLLTEAQQVSTQILPNEECST
jgi:PD-(D/E)XK nuclease superfamily protein